MYRKTLKKRHNARVRKKNFKRLLIILGALIFVGVVSTVAYQVFNNAKRETVNLDGTQLSDKQSKKLLATSDGNNFYPNNLGDISNADGLKYSQKAYDDGIYKHASGIIEVPSVNIKLPIFNGTNRYTLALGASTYLNTNPGTGNYALFSHNMFQPGLLFSDLNGVKVGNIAYVKTKEHTYKYKITDKKVIGPKQKWVGDTPAPSNVLYDDGTNKLTLITCTDINATHRLVVTGKLEK